MRASDHGSQFVNVVPSDTSPVSWPGPQTRSGEGEFEVPVVVFAGGSGVSCGPIGVRCSGVRVWAVVVFGEVASRETNRRRAIAIMKRIIVRRSTRKGRRCARGVARDGSLGILVCDG